MRVPQLPCNLVPARLVEMLPVAKWIAARVGLIRFIFKVGFAIRLRHSGNNSAQHSCTYRKCGLLCRMNPHRNHFTMNNTTGKLVRPAAVAHNHAFYPENPVSGALNAHIAERRLANSVLVTELLLAGSSCVTPVEMYRIVLQGIIRCLLFKIFQVRLIALPADFESDFVITGLVPSLP